MSKRIGMFFLFLFLMLLLIGCGSDETSGSSSSVDVAIADASYILPGEDGTPGKENTGMLAVDLEVTNNSDYSITVSSFDGIRLYDEGEQKSPQTDLYNADIDLEGSFSGDIGPEKMTTFTSIFYVEKDKEYEIGIQPFSTNPDAEIGEATVPLNTAEYSESFDALQEPEQALLAYVDTIYLDQDNPDYESLVSADKAALQEEAKGLFADQIERPFSSISIPQEEIDQLYETYKSLLRDKAEITAETTANANDKAVVSVEYSTLPLDLYDPVSEYRDEYRENTDDYDSEAMDEYALENIDQILNDIEPESSRETLEIVMTKEDGLWSVDTSEWPSEQLAEAFSAGAL